MPKSLLTPDIMVRRVYEVPAETLAARGVRAVISDLDNTLVGWHEEDITAEISTWLKDLRDAGIKVCLASNTRRLPRLTRLATQWGVLHVPGNAGKPGTKGLEHALRLMEARPHEAAMVGDQLFTDIVAGNRLGLLTVLVNPLSPKEFIGTRLISRRLEQLVLRGSRRRPE
jgi:HAD superfamily phosphatase (TIGR01668 family)